MDIQRRDFFKLVGVGSASLLPEVGHASTAPPHDYNESLGVLVDTTTCIGCRQCEWACNEHNKLAERELSYFEDQGVFERHRRPDDAAYTVVNAVADPKAPEGKSFMKVQCMHCNEPACVSACLVGALSKGEHGPVMYDAWECMGCRYCLVACPFQIPAYEYRNAFDPEVRKCTFCVDRLAEGRIPACVEACPVEALIFGKRGKLLELAHSRIKKDPERYVDHVYGEHEIAGTAWMYLASVDFVNTELPKLPDQSLPQITESIQHGIFRGFVAPLALYGLLGFIMYSARKQRDEKGEHHE
jgi:Fe-S-cluster-containing dehydrogenase component